MSNHGILIVDDSSVARIFVRQCFEVAGCNACEFFEAGHGGEAMKFLESHQENIDLIVTDLNMPVLDGAGLVDALKAHTRWRHVPVIVITSASNPARDTQLMAKGAFAVLAKPLTPATLNEKLACLRKAQGE